MLSFVNSIIIVLISMIVRVIIIDHVFLERFFAEVQE